MSVNDLLASLATHWTLALGYFVLLPVFTALVGLFYTRRAQLQGLDYLYSVLVHAAAIPGIVSAMLVFYSLFFLRANLLHVNVVLYFVPLLSMGLVFILVRRKTDFERLPGFGRLSGLMTLIAVVCLLTLLIQKLIIFVGFVAPVEVLLVLGIVLWWVIKRAVAKLSR